MLRALEIERHYSKDRDPRGVSEPRAVRRQHGRDRRGEPALLRQSARRAHPRGGGAAQRAAAKPDAPRAAHRRRKRARCSPPPRGSVRALSPAVSGIPSPRLRWPDPHGTALRAASGCATSRTPANRHDARPRLCSACSSGRIGSSAGVQPPSRPAQRRRDAGGYASMEVLAQTGSADFFDDTIAGQVDGTRSRRSPGSTLKPFIYALAMDQGLIHPHPRLPMRRAASAATIPRTSMAILPARSRPPMRWPAAAMCPPSRWPSSYRIPRFTSF